MLRKSLGILVIIAFLCGTVSFFPQEASAYDCGNLERGCRIATDTAITACTFAILEPTPYTEAICAALLWNAGVVCGLYRAICGSGSGGGG